MIKVALVSLVLAHHRLATVLMLQTHLRGQFKVKGQTSSAGKVVKTKKHAAESYSQPRTLLQRQDKRYVVVSCLCLHFCCCILSASESFLPPASICCSSHSTVMSSSLPFLSIISFPATILTLIPTYFLLSSPLSQGSNLSLSFIHYFKQWCRPDEPSSKPMRPVKQVEQQKNSTDTQKHSGEDER